jgi:DNA-binding MarR family transcriptional regulator
MMMGQTEIYQYLKARKDNFYSSKQLAEIMGLSQSTVSANLRGLVYRKLIRRKLAKKGYRRNRFVYGVG